MLTKFGEIVAILSRMKVPVSLCALIVRIYEIVLPTISGIQIKVSWYRNHMERTRIPKRFQLSAEAERIYCPPDLEST